MGLKRVLITGGAGFIARATTPVLLEAGWTIRALDLLDPQVHPSGLPELAPQVEFIHGDAGDPELLESALQGVDAVLHLAARTGVGQSMYAVRDYVQTNVGATAVLLELIASGRCRPRKVVVASSRAVYGEGAYDCARCGPVAPPVREREHLERGEWEARCPTCDHAVSPAPTREDKPLAPGSVYAITKRDQEEMVLCVAAAYGVAATALRYFNVYGPGQPPGNPYTGVIPALAARVLAGGTPDIYEDGKPLRDFVHVEDVARANLMAIESDSASGRALNIGSGQPVSILEAANVLTEALGGRLAPQVSGKFRIGDIRHCYADLTRATELLGYRPTVSFEAGIGRMAGWLRENCSADPSAEAASELAARGLLGEAPVR